VEGVIFPLMPSLRESAKIAFVCASVRRPSAKLSAMESGSRGLPESVVSAPPGSPSLNVPSSYSSSVDKVGRVLAVVSVNGSTSKPEASIDCSKPPAVLVDLTGEVSGVAVVSIVSPSEVVVVGGSTTCGVPEIVVNRAGAKADVFTSPVCGSRFTLSVSAPEAAVNAEDASTVPDANVATTASVSVCVVGDAARTVPRAV